MFSARAETGNGKLPAPRGKRRTRSRPVAGIKRERPEDETPLHHQQFEAVPLEGRMPEEVRRANLELVASAFEAHGVPYFVVRTESLTRHVLGVYVEHRPAAVQALLETYADDRVYLRVLGPDRVTTPAIMAEAAQKRRFKVADVLRVCRFYVDPGTDYHLGFSHGCDVEFWTSDPERPGVRVAPRYNVAADVVAESELAPATTEIGGRTYPTGEVFTRRMVEDITFPVDVVYAWVDGDDPAWRARRDRVKAELEGREAPVHEESVAEGRFRDRDELLYSLRSLEMFAPWVRNVYLVTDQQVPEWLDTSAPHLHVVDHRELFTEAALPTFNSHVISSYLHRIDGLAEHFLYINDDVFFGRPVSPRHFFTPAGQARVFASRHRRPFGEASAHNAPHFNAAHNIRRILEREFGVTVSRATLHTPVPLLRSELAHLEERFAEEYAVTRANQFRGPEDIAPGILFHHYSQITGVGVASAIDYHYFNVGDDRRLDDLRAFLELQDRDVFCLNDADAEELTPMPEEEIARFLERYFPIRSRFEKR